MNIRTMQLQVHLYQNSASVDTASADETVVDTAQAVGIAVDTAQVAELVVVLDTEAQQALAAAAR
ncbi:MAG: hypothetical protein ACO3CN_06795 [Candidatus Nanopelagicales bacterium]